MSLQETDRDALLSEERLERGLVLILPGIEGESFLNHWIRDGLVAAGVPYGIEIHDWTRGPLLLFWNLRQTSRHREQAQRIAEKIVKYRERFPTQPVYVVGHSGGGAMTVYSLATLPADVKVTAGIMMVPAISPGFDIKPALRQTEQGLWCYSSYGDCILVGIGTVLAGTCDGRHSPSAGMLGFHEPQPEHDNAVDVPALHQLRYQWRMAGQLNLGGHLSCVNPHFIRKWISPILYNAETGASRGE